MRFRCIDFDCTDERAPGSPFCPKHLAMYRTKPPPKKTWRERLKAAWKALWS